MILDAWQEVAATLARNKLRTLLTACGVFWGIFMLIVMLGLGKGLHRGTQKKLGGMVTRSVFVWSQRTSMPYRGLQPGRYLRFRNDDIQAVSRVPGVAHVSPRLRLGGWRDGGRVVAGAKAANFAVVGDTPAFRWIEPMTLLGGRFLNPLDEKEARKVALIGDQAREVLFGASSPVGSYVKIQGVQFQIVGEVFSDKGGDDGDRIRSTLFVPFSTFQLAFNQRDRVGWFALTTGATARPEEVEKAVRRTLAARHSVHPEDDQAIGSFNAAEKFDQLEGLFRGIRLFVWLVGTLTLLAGVLGVSNILLITVKERTKEIGVRKALGATPGRIIAMVLKESVVLTSFAGYLGVVGGVAALETLGNVVAAIPDAPLSGPEVDLNAALIATLVLVVSGTAAGIIPARHAARISPVEALRSE